MVRALFLAITLCMLALPARAGDVVVFAASSLKTALDEVLAVTNVRISYGGSGALARQIMQGAPADIFFSANGAWMNVVDEAGLIAHRKDLLGNQIVIVSANHTTFDTKGRVAMGLLASVPAGIYGQAYLEAEGLWESVSPRVIETDSARAALALAAKGEVAYAVVYATDAQAEPRVNVVSEFAPRADLPIVYPIARLSAADAGAKPVFETLTDERARAIFARHGFAPL